MKQRQQLLLISAIIIVITAAHYTTSHALVYVHDISRRLYYLPIILASFWFGKRGGILSALSITVLYSPHALFSWYGKNPRYLDNLIEIIFFNVVGYLIGSYIEKKNQQRIEAEASATQLQEAYNELQKHTDKIMRLEEELRLADRMSILGELSASLAHEVRNPLGGIQGAAEIFQKKIPASDPDSEFVQIQIREIQRLNKVVSNYLELSKAEKKEKINANLNEIINNSLALIRIQTKKYKINLQYAASRNSGIQIMCDPVQLQQVMLNLLLNAIHAMPDGGNLQIETDVLTDQKEVKISVVDYGGGINTGDRGKIFQPFFTTKTEGTGLGLSIVKRIVEQHEGHIDFVCRENGTTFDIYLPIATK